MTERMRLSLEELDAEVATPLPAKEVLSLLDLNIDIDLALDLAAPIDLAIAANAQVAAPIDAAVSANVLSFFSSATAAANQQVMIDQLLTGEAIADAPQSAFIDQSNDVIDGGSTAGSTDAGAVSTGATTGGPTTDGATTGGATTGGATTGGATTDGATADLVAPIGDTVGGVTEAVTGSVNGVEDTVGTVTSGGLLDDGLLNIDVKVHLDADLAAPIAGAVAANANVAAPIDAAVAANVGSFGSDAVAIAEQTAIITQHMDGVTAHATAAQDAEIIQ